MVRGTATRTTFTTLVLGFDQVVQENNGILLTDSRHSAPYSIQQFLDQINNNGDRFRDVTGRTTVPGSINAVSPTVLNTARLATHTEFNVIPPRVVRRFSPETGSE